MSPSAQHPPTASQRYRSHEAGSLDERDVGNQVRVAGFVHNKRELGGLVFVELRDPSGVVQCVLTRDEPAFDLARSLTLESVVSVEGEVVLRAAGARNDKLGSGAVELRVSSIDVLSRAEALPFAVRDHADPPEELRLCYRFLDLRRTRVRDNIVLRSRIVARLRELLTQRGFLEVQTPILTASSPEGARDFLVPSRLSPGKFYALPQAPQLFKQLLMVGGFERYFQIAPCFRDEDARADRSPGEFYQLDLELAFVEQEEVFAVIEPVLDTVFREFGRYAATSPPYPRIVYRDALLRYGSDKPDLRNPLVYQDITSLLPELALPASALARALVIPKGGSRSRRWLARLCDEARALGAEAGYFAAQHPASGFGHEVLQQHREALNHALAASSDDAVFVLVAPLVTRAAGPLRTRVAAELALTERATYRFCWVVDFPMYERDPTTGAIGFSHNPFSMPKGGEQALLLDPLDVIAHQYDIVCNGIELSSGALRNHRPELLLRAFEIAGYEAAEVEARFGGLLRALRCGAPPHGGLAPGVDRMLMLLADEPNLREVTPFPLTQSAQDVLLGAPSAVRPEQLRELGLQLADDVSSRR